MMIFSPSLFVGGKNPEITLIACDRLESPHKSAADAVLQLKELTEFPDPQGILRELLLYQSQLCDQIAINQSNRRQILAQVAEEHLLRANKLTSVQEKCLLDEYHITYILQTIRLSLTHGIADVKLPSHETVEAAVQAFRASENAMKEASSALNASRRGSRRKADAPVPSALPSSTNLHSDETSAVGSEYTVCCVCFDGDSSEDNPIVFCERCNISVHKCCYGIVAIPDDDWFCDFCIFRNSTRAKLTESAPKKKKTGRPLTSERKENEKGKSAEANSNQRFKDTARQPCALCPLEGGALKAAVDGRFVHVNCALWTPSVKVLELSTMSSIVIDSVDCAVNSVDNNDSVVSHMCRFCKKQHGRPKKCSFSSCSEYFHPLCAWFHGLYMHVDSFETSCKLDVYCEAHTPDEVIPPADKLAEAIKIMSIDASFVVSIDKTMRTTLPSAAPVSLSTQVMPLNSQFSEGSFELNKADTVEEDEQSLATIMQLQSRALRIRQRVTVQHALRNRARHSEHTRKAKKMRRRLQYIQKKEREARQRALKEDRYEPGRCAVCFRNNEEVESIQKLIPQLASTSSPSDPTVSTKNSESSSFTHPELKMLRCDRCDIDVHQSCYGISGEELQQAQESFKAKLTERRRKRSALANSSEDDSSDSESLGAFGGPNALHSGWLCRRCAEPSDKDKVYWLPVSAYHSVPVILSEGHLRRMHHD